jgi:hypothetical protein
MTRAIARVCAEIPTRNPSKAHAVRDLNDVIFCLSLPRSRAAVFAGLLGSDRDTERQSQLLLLAIFIQCNRSAANDALPWRRPGRTFKLTKKSRSVDFLKVFLVENACSNCTASDKRVNQTEFSLGSTASRESLRPPLAPIAARPRWWRVNPSRSSRQRARDSRTPCAARDGAPLLPA